MLSDALLYILVFAGALLVLILVAVKACSWWRLFMYGENIHAVVRHVSLVEDEVSGHVQHFEAEWTQLETNKPFVFRGSTRGRFLYRTGDVISVHIDPKNPKHYKIKPEVRKVLG
jgi:hypothetical protein